MSEAEQAQLEEAYFADDALFERFLAVKDDLVDAYARGALGGQKRQEFEQHFLASEPRRQRVEEAKEFIRAINSHSTKAAINNNDLDWRGNRWRQFVSDTFRLRPWVWKGAVAALLLVALAGSFVLVRWFQSQRTERERALNQAAAGRQQEEERTRVVIPSVNDNRVPTNPTPTPGSETTPTPTTPGKQSRAAVQVASLFLSPFSPRDVTSSNSLLLRPDTTAVRLQLAFKADGYRSYEVIVRTMDGRQVFSRRGLKATSGMTGQNVTITVEPTIFSHQDYIITLNGLNAQGKLEPIGDYYFRVQRS
jgi:type II secretory pathway pseudopilin PulG